MIFYENVGTLTLNPETQKPRDPETQRPRNPEIMRPRDHHKSKFPHPISRIAHPESRISNLESHNVCTLACSLLGKTLISEIDGKYSSAKIVETEAYRAPEDKASHAFGGKRTSRTETMYGSPGIAYIYLCYGIHHMLNIVTGPVDTAHAILIRAVEPLEGIEHMLRRRNIDKLQRNLTAGPGLLTSALGITTSLNGVDLTSSDSPIRIVNRGFEIPDSEIIKSPRVGVSYAGLWARKPWRFRIKNSLWTSPAK